MFFVLNLKCSEIVDFYNDFEFSLLSIEAYINLHFWLLIMQIINSRPAYLSTRRPRPPYPYRVYSFALIYVSIVICSFEVLVEYMLNHLIALLFQLLTWVLVTFRREGEGVTNPKSYIISRSVVVYWCPVSQWSYVDNPDRMPHIAQTNKAFLLAICATNPFS